MDKKSILEEVLSSQDEKTLQNFDPTGAVLALLKTVDSRGADIIRQRYSLEGRPSRTLEEIGSNYGVTRERIRQVQSATLKELRAKQKSLEDVVRVIASILNATGRLMEENHLLETLLEMRESNKADRAAILFILDLHDDFKRFEETQETHRAWGTKEADLEGSRQVINAFLEILSKREKPIAHEEVTTQLADHPLYQELPDELNDNALLAYLMISKKVRKNPFDEWGMADWAQISPRGVKDKAFIVLQKGRQPLHFVDIAKEIDSSGFDLKKAHPQTVHNELIKDGRFVLVGRGIYALKDWGYEPGTVGDVLERILKDNGEPMSKEGLVKEVLKQRMVKKNTVLLGLQNKNKFVRQTDGNYWLAV
ncbi:sigma factor-like helix-turn-helix DNA-binding protein [Patescibacteria group bacterium]